MKSWHDIAAELKLAAQNEGEIHPHVPAERAHLFHSHDAGSTEYEFLNLIHALVVATKPTLCIETGTFYGLGTIAIAAALEFNKHGTLISLDIEDCMDAKALIARYALSNRVNFVKANALEFINQWGGASFDFAFIDSGSERLEETQKLVDRNLMIPGSFVLLHDASPLRNEGPTLGSMFEEKCPLKGHTIGLSRGLRIMHV